MKLKAVYYARVSTEEEKQLNALSKQCDDLMDCINKNQWEFVDSYVDEGKSGTTTKKRDEYKRLCEDIESNKFHIIVIKSQDRLMRNVMDWYIFVDKL
jgi:DNA invertase Pin-like site-specific DNA recombinase